MHQIISLIILYHLLHIHRGKLIECIIRPQYNDSYIDLAQNSQFVSFLEQPSLSFDESHRTIPFFANRLYLDLSSPHLQTN